MKLLPSTSVWIHSGYVIRTRSIDGSYVTWEEDQDTGNIINRPSFNICGNLVVLFDRFVLDLRTAVRPSARRTV